MERDQIISQIAAKHLRIGTLGTQKSDSLDFHEGAVWSVQAALVAAYDAGRASVAAEDADAPQTERSEVWHKFSLDDAIEHLKSGSMTRTIQDRLLR